MAFIRQLSNGKYYLCTSKSGKAGMKKKRDIKNWFLIKYNSTGFGELTFRNVYVPKELIGKRIRLKVEVIK